METQVFIKLSAMIDKMGIDLSTIQGKTNEETGLKMISIIIKNIYKAEQELYELIALKNKIETEEAKKINVIAFIKELMKVDGMADFLA
jgi:hypothetical protein